MSGFGNTSVIFDLDGTLVDSEPHAQQQGRVVSRVRSTVNSWVGAGLLSDADGQTVTRTAAQATYAS